VGFAWPQWRPLEPLCIWEPQGGVYLPVNNCWNISPRSEPPAELTDGEGSLWRQRTTVHA